MEMERKDEGRQGTALDGFHDRARTWTMLSVAGTVGLALVYGAASAKASDAYQGLRLYSEIGSRAADLQPAYDSAVLVRDLALLGLVVCLAALLVAVLARVAADLLAAYRES